MSLKLLPRGVSTWVITDPVIPDQFSLNDYTKSYSLKSYDVTIAEGAQEALKVVDQGAQRRAQGSQVCSGWHRRQARRAHPLFPWIR